MWYCLTSRSLIKVDVAPLSRRVWTDWLWFENHFQISMRVVIAFLSWSNRTKRVLVTVVMSLLHIAVETPFENPLPCHPSSRFVLWWTALP